MAVLITVLGDIFCGASAADKGLSLSCSARIMRYCDWPLFFTHSGEESGVRLDMSSWVGTVDAQEVNGKMSALLQRFSSQWPLKVLYNTAYNIHPFMYTFTHTDGGVNHAGCRRSR